MTRRHTHLSPAHRRKAIELIGRAEPETAATDAATHLAQEKAKRTR